MKGSNLTYVKNKKEVNNHRFEDQPHSKEKCFKLGLHNVSKMYRHRSIPVAENCLNFSKLHSLYSLFTLCVTMYLANQMEPSCPRWPPPMEMLVAQVSN